MKTSEWQKQLGCEEMDLVESDKLQALVKKLWRPGLKWKAYVNPLADGDVIVAEDRPIEVYPDVKVRQKVPGFSHYATYDSDPFYKKVKKLENAIPFEMPYGVAEQVLDRLNMARNPYEQIQVQTTLHPVELIASAEVAGFSAIQSPSDEVIPIGFLRGPAKPLIFITEGKLRSLFFQCIVFDGGRLIGHGYEDGRNGGWTFQEKFSREFLLKESGKLWEFIRILPGAEI